MDKPTMKELKDSQIALGRAQEIIAALRDELSRTLRALELSESPCFGARRVLGPEDAGVL